MNEHALISDFTEADALYGAAYQVTFERCVPDNCVTAEELAKIKDTAAKIIKWAATQNAEVRAAYERAVPEIIARAAARYENNNRYTQLIAARKNLPEPPP